MIPNTFTSLTLITSVTSSSSSKTTLSTTSYEQIKISHAKTFRNILMKQLWFKILVFNKLITSFQIKRRLCSSKFDINAKKLSTSKLFTLKRQSQIYPLFLHSRPPPSCLFCQDGISGGGGATSLGRPPRSGTFEKEIMSQYSGCYVAS